MRVWVFRTRDGNKYRLANNWAPIVRIWREKYQLNTLAGAKKKRSAQQMIVARHAAHKRANVHPACKPFEKRPEKPHVQHTHTHTHACVADNDGDAGQPARKWKTKQYTQTEERAVLIIDILMFECVCVCVRGNCVSMCIGCWRRVYL